MRIFFIFSFLAVGVFAFNAQPRSGKTPVIKPFIFEDVINETIESIRPLIPDPLQIESLQLNYPDSDDVLSGNLSVANLNLEGLQGFQVTSLNFEIIGVRLNFTVRFPFINLFTEYDLNVDIGEDDTNVFGSGNLTAQLEDVEITATTRVNLTNGVSLEDLAVQLYLGRALFDVNGLYNDAELSANITEILNNNVTSLIDDNQALITQIISPIIQDILNYILGLIVSSSTPTSQFGVDLNKRV